LLFLLRVVMANRGHGWWRGLGTVLSDGFVVALTAIVVAVPFVVTSVKTEQVHWGWVRGEFASAYEVLRHLGIWWVLILVPAVGAVGTFACAVRNRSVLIRAVSVVIATALPLIGGVLAWSDGIRGFSWMLLGVWAVISCCAAAIVFGLNERIERRALGVLTLSGVYIGVGAELLFLMDRMNTIFKFYHFVWLSLSIAALAFTIGWCRRGQSDTRSSRIVRRIGGSLVGASVALAVCGTVINLRCMVGFQRVDGPRPTLNGQRYLERMSREDRPLIEWLRRNVAGAPTVLEAWGESYGPYTRIAMHTGLTTVLGWEHHVRQRGASDIDVQRRKRDIATIYATSDIATALRLLKRYNVSYVVVSALERTTYGGAGLMKFERYPDYFSPMERSGAGSVYKVTLPPSGVIDGVR